MRNTDKNIAVVTMILIIGLLFLSVNRYHSTQKENAQNFQIDNHLETTAQKDGERSDPNDTTDQDIIPLITTQELNQKIITDSINTTIIDLRSQEEFDAGHIKGSYHVSGITNSMMRRNVVLVTENGNEDTIISYYRDIAHSNTVYNLLGGIVQWRQNGLALLSLTSDQTFTNASKIQFLEPRDISEMIRNTDNMEKTIIIDTRRAGNFTNGHVENAINIPLPELEYRNDELPHGSKIIVYGANDISSFQAGVLLYDLGFINTKTMKGGFDAWRTYGYPITQ